MYALPVTSSTGTIFSSRIELVALSPVGNAILPRSQPSLDWAATGADLAGAGRAGSIRSAGATEAAGCAESYRACSCGVRQSPARDVSSGPASLGRWLTPELDWHPIMKRSNESRPSNVGERELNGDMVGLRLACPAG